MMVFVHFLLVISFLYVHCEDGNVLLRVFNPETNLNDRIPFNGEVFIPIIPADLYESRNENENILSGEVPLVSGEMIGGATIPIMTTDMDILVESLNFQISNHDTVQVKLSNPFDPLRFVSFLGILETGSQWNLLPNYVATAIQLPLSSKKCELRGIYSISSGYLSAVTLDLSLGGIREPPTNITVCVSPFPQMLISKSLMQSLGVCHCPTVGLRVCP